MEYTEHYGVGSIILWKRIRVLGQNIVSISFICSLTKAPKLHFGPRGRAKSSKIWLKGQAKKYRAKKTGQIRASKVIIYRVMLYITAFKVCYELIFKLTDRHSMVGTNVTNYKLLVINWTSHRLSCTFSNMFYFQSIFQIKSAVLRHNCLLKNTRE